MVSFTDKQKKALSSRPNPNRVKLSPKMKALILAYNNKNKPKAKPKAKKRATISLK